MHVCVYTHTDTHRGKCYFQSMPLSNHFLKRVLFTLNEYCLRIFNLLILLRTYVTTPDGLFYVTQIYIFMEKLAIISRF